MNKELYISRSGLKGKRGWTDLLIKRFLKEPDLIVDNPYYKNQPEMKLWLITKIELIEQESGFKVMKDSADKRKTTAQRAVNTKIHKIINYVNNLSITLPDYTEDQLTELAVRSYNNYNQHREYFEPATKDSDSDFLNRITINYLRHQCTRYENELRNIFGKVGTDKAYQLLKDRINSAILEKFSFLYKVESFEQEPF